MTRLPPALGRLSRNERALREAELRMKSWAKLERRKSEREKRAGLQADIDASCAMPLRQALSENEHRAIYQRVRFAKL